MNILTCEPLNMLPCKQLISPMPSAMLCSFGEGERKCSQGVALFKFSIHFFGKIDVCHHLQFQLC